MRIHAKAEVLTVYIGEDDKWHTGLLYPAVVERLQETGVAGVTVLKAVEGIGWTGEPDSDSHAHRRRSRPIAIQAVDVPDRIAVALAALDEMLTDALVTVHEVDATRISPEPKPKE